VVPANILNLRTYTVAAFRENDHDFTEGISLDCAETAGVRRWFSPLPRLHGDLGGGLLRPVTANAANILKH